MFQQEILRSLSGQVHRRYWRLPDSIYETVRVKLRGLDRQAIYRIEDIDVEDANLISGAELMDKGVRINTQEVPGAAIVFYQKQ